MTEEAASTSTKIGKTIKAYCGSCRGDRNCLIKGHHIEGETESSGYAWWRNWYLLVCCGCDHPFALSSFSDSESYVPVGYLPNGDTEYAEECLIRTWPAKANRPRPGWFSNDQITCEADTDKLSAALRELYGALDHDLLGLATIGIRTAFDICSELLGVDPHTPFFEKLNQLHENGHISTTDKEHLAVLVEAGSATAHRGWSPSATEVSTLMDTLEDFLYGALILPSELRKKSERLANIRERVPKRLAKPKGKKKK